METAIEMTAGEQIDMVARELGLTIAAEFVPWSKSRNKAEKDPSLNWRVTVRCNARDVIVTDYSAGCGHTPAYKAPVKRLGALNSLMRREAMVWECEHGRAALVMEGIGHITGTGKPLQPDTRNVLYSLASDCDVLDAGGFEQWAGDLGYDTDSRKAEAIYRACLEIALKLRAGLGEDGLGRLRNACQGY